MEKHFLEQYKTHDKPEAKQAAERKALRTGEKEVTADRSKRIEAYIGRLEEVFLHPDKERRSRRTEIYKEKFLYPEVIIKPEDFPEGYFEHQKRELKNRGMGDMEFSREDKRQEIIRVQEAQKKSLDAWIDHLSSDDSHYPPDIKYFAMQGILRAGSFDKENYRFGKRGAGTTAPFCQLDHEVLSKVLGALEAVHHKGDATPYHKELLDLIERGKDFGSMYAEAIRYLDKEASKEKALEITAGEWRVFKQGSDPQELVKAFAGKRAFLCLGNIGDASGYLKHGDVHVYFSNNRAGTPVWPRVAVAVKPDLGAYELRGTCNANEDIDAEIAKTDIIKSHLATVPNGESFAKKDADMRQLTALYQKCFREDRKTKEKTYLNPQLSKEELVFLYEINSKIEGFGYGKDPRVKELRDGRNKEADMPVVFECTKAQIARNVSEISDVTKSYVGAWNPAVLQTVRQYPSVTNLYESFPDKKIFFQTLETDPTISTPKQAEEKLQEDSTYLSPYGKDILQRTEFSKDRETYQLVRFTLEQLGFPNGATTEEIYKKAEESGLDLCPAEVGPHLRLSYKGGEWMLIAMKQITDRDGRPRMFLLARDDAELKLDAHDAKPGRRWIPLSQFVFLLRKPPHQS